LPDADVGDFHNSSLALRKSMRSVVLRWALANLPQQILPPELLETALQAGFW